MQPQSVNTAIELTPIVLALIGGVFAVIRAVAVYYIDKRVHDQQLRELLDHSVVNALGIIQQAASGAAIKSSPHLAGIVPAKLVPGVQYVLDHAPDAVARWGITPEAIAEKLISRAGLREIDTNIAVSASAATPVVVPPLAPSSPITEPTAADLNRQELQRVLASQGSAA
jgi:hypothetical protein